MVVSGHLSPDHQGGAGEVASLRGAFSHTFSAPVALSNGETEGVRVRESEGDVALG